MPLGPRGARWALGTPSGAFEPRAPTAHPGPLKALGAQRQLMSKGYKLVPARVRGENVSGTELLPAYVSPLNLAKFAPPRSYLYAAKEQNRRNVRDLPVQDLIPYRTHFRTCADVWQAYTYVHMFFNV